MKLGSFPARLSKRARRSLLFGVGLLGLAVGLFIGMLKVVVPLVSAQLAEKTATLLPVVGAVVFIVTAVSGILAFLESGQVSSRIRQTKKVEASIAQLREFQAKIFQGALLAPEERAATIDALKQEIKSSANLQFVEDIRAAVVKEQKTKRVFGLLEDTDVRLRVAIDQVSKRGNLNLSIGVVTAFTGLIFLGWPLVTVPITGNEDTLSWVQRFAPRLFLVLFVEVLAYFFLKLYKASTDEIHYLNNELTNAESKNIAIALCEVAGEISLFKIAINSLLRVERNHILKKGETTLELEKQRLEAKEILAAVKASSMLKPQKD